MPLKLKSILYLIFRDEITMIAFERVIRMFTGYMCGEGLSVRGLMAALLAAVVAQRVHPNIEPPFKCTQATADLSTPPRTY